MITRSPWRGRPLVDLVVAGLLAAAPAPGCVDITRNCSLPVTIRGPRRLAPSGRDSAPHANKGIPT